MKPLARTLKRLNPLNWPLRTQLAVVLTAAVLLPLILAYFAIQPNLRELSLASLRSFVAENGERQRQAVTNEFTRARASLDAYVNNDTYSRRLTTILLRNSSLLRDSPTSLVDPGILRAQFQRILLNPSTTLFRSIRLIDREGRLVTTGSLGNIEPVLLQADQSRSAAYRDAVNEQLVPQARSQIITVTERGGQPVIDITNIIRWRDGNAIGYLIAEVDTASLFETTLSNASATYPVYSFALSNNRLLFSPEATLEQAVGSSDSTGVERALAGETGLDLYRLGQSLDQVVAFYAPLPDLPLVMVSEAPVSAATAQGTNVLDARVVLIVLVSIAFLVVLVAGFQQWVVRPLVRLSQAADSMAAGDFARPVPETGREDEVGLVATRLDSLRRRTQTRLETLESRVTAQARDMSATQDIGRFAVTQRDAQTLMDRVVNLIVERFPAIYHAQIFLIDNDRQWALLRASTGEPGRQLLARGHRLGVGSVSVIGQVSQQGRVVVARDTEASQVHRRNEFLPDTRAELAIPLRIGNDIIGALDVQSQERDAFDDDLVAILQTMADQIAVAIQNARLYQESMQRMSEIERGNRAATQTVWREYMSDQRVPQLASEAGASAADRAELAALRAQALETGRVAVGERTERDTVPVAVPVVLRGETLGAVEWELPAQEVDDNKLQLAQELANRLAVSLDNARLFQESRRATERERVVNTIAARLTAQTSVEDILQTAVREVGQALRAPQVVIRMQRPDGPSRESAAQGERTRGEPAQPSPELETPPNGHANGHGNGSG